MQATFDSFPNLILENDAVLLRPLLILMWKPFGIFDQ
jgi:hypothetical protein